MQLNIKNFGAQKEPTPVKSIFEAGTGIGVQCPECGQQQFFNEEWPIETSIDCSAIIGEDSSGDHKIICECCFIIKNDTPIED